MGRSGIIVPLGTAVLIAGFLAVAASAWLVAASLRLRSALDFLLAAYLTGSAAAIAAALVLSPLELVTRGGLLAAALAMLAVAAAVWHVRGRPRAPALRPAASACRAALRDPPLALMAVAVTVALAYAAVLAVATPSNDYDVLWYHLARAAIWHQQHAVGYIANAPNEHLNMNPPGAEILSTWAMTLEGSDRFAGVFQVIALLATMVAIVRVARLLGLGARAALFGALAYAALPVVALQATTAGNDVVVTSFLVAIVPFMLQESRIALGLGALALALAVVTKGTVLFAIPVLLVAAAVLVPRRRWWPVAAAGTLAVAVGGFWYLVNRAEAGSLTPVYEEGDIVGDRRSDPLRVLAFMARLAIDAVDPAGSVGLDRYVFALAGAVVLAGGLAVALRARSRRVALGALAAAAVAALPVLFATAYDTLLRGYQRAFVGIGESDLAFLGWSREERVPTAFTSWYGALGLLAFLVAVPLVVREIRRGALRRGVLLLTLAPVLTLPVVAVTWSYSPWHGRFFMPAVALSAATWGVQARVRPIVWGMSAIAAVTLLLSFVHYREKPSGLSVLEGTTPRSVWTASRLEILTSWAPSLTAEGRVILHLDRAMRDGETVGLRLRGDNVSYPYFGATLDRRVVFVDGEGNGLDASVDWLVTAPERTAPVCAGGWRQVVASGGWRVYRRVARCPGESAAS